MPLANFTHIKSYFMYIMYKVALTLMRSPEECPLADKEPAVVSNLTARFIYLHNI